VRGKTRPQKPEAIVTFTLVQGQVSPAARHEWNTFWAKLIADAKAKTLAEDKAK
jgi:hypothetical protein